MEEATSEVPVVAEAVGLGTAVPTADTDAPVEAAVGAVEIAGEPTVVDAAPVEPVLPEAVPLVAPPRPAENAPPAPPAEPPPEPALADRAAAEAGADFPGAVAALATWLRSGWTQIRPSNRQPYWPPSVTARPLPTST